jgi:predicted transcriptional regulator of viral defense system
VNASEALSRLRRMRVLAVTTSDAAALLRLAPDAASHTLRRLATAGLISPVRKGLWAIADPLDPLTITDYVTAPYPSYVSLQSALYLHGMIMQIPAVIYVVSLARSGRIKTPAAVYSVHHVAPEFFDGYDLLASGMKIATPEKALVDLFYLSGTRTRLFAALPELEFPRSFRKGVARGWAARIAAPRIRTVVNQRLERVLGKR